MEKTITFSDVNSGVELNISKLEDDLMAALSDSDDQYISLIIGSLDEWLAIRKEIDNMAKELWNAPKTDEE